MHFLQEYKKLFEAYLQSKYIRKEPAGLYKPVNYIMGLGGKRIRPVLSLVACQMFYKEASKALPLAYALEMFHNFSLVHDDIMDEAQLRRGSPSVHIKYDANTAILSGDAMLVLAYEALMEFTEVPLLPSLIRVFNQTALEVCEGQSMDMDFESRMDVQIPEYLKMIELKTAALLGGALEMGAIAGGASTEATRQLAAFGRNFGVAFQLQDDILDAYGDPQKFGKKLGGDIARNKKTFLLIKALELAKEEKRNSLKRLLALPPAEEAKKIKLMLELYKELGVKDLALEAKTAYQRKGLAHLEATPVPEDKKKTLRQLAESLLVRDY